MTGRITRLVKASSGPVLIVIDGEEWGSLPRGVVRSLELAVDDVLETDMLASRAESVMDACALERGLVLVSSRERSRAEVVRTLMRDGYPVDAVERAAERLEEIGAVDDARFAAALSRTLTSARGYGRRRVARELAAAGVDDDLAASALDEHVPEAAEHARALARARSLARGSAGSVSRLAGKLARRGFSPAIAWKAAREVLGGQDEELPPEDID